MTRTEYILLAQAIQGIRPPFNAAERWSQWIDTLVSVADALADRNPHFNRELFLKNCGVPQP